MSNGTQQTWLPDLIYIDGNFVSDRAIVCDNSGAIIQIIEGHQAANAVRLKNRALLPGLVNAHSHAFQRVIGGLKTRLTVFGRGANRCTTPRTVSNRETFMPFRAWRFSRWR
jgi:cytosine/adenosine deaminase-related metal-dependent hydrolase